MLRVLGSPKRLCDGLTRRDMLNVGASALGGLGLSTLLEQQAAASGATAESFGKAKNCIILFLYGSPSQLETFDMKPEAPVEVRGSMQPIPSSLPGLPVCEHLPEMAKIMDRTTVIRSVTHPHPIHGVAYAMTGTAVIDVGMELNPYDERHHPYFASCVEYLERQQRGGRPGDFIQNVALPFPFSSKRSDQPFRAGPYAAYLGAGYNPVWTEFQGEGTVSVRKERANGEFWFEGPEPYLGCDRGSHFRLAAAESLPGMSLDRLDRRRSLLTQFEQQRQQLERGTAGRSLSQFQEMAYSILADPQVGQALDVRHESEATRDRYGMTLFGQSCLAARRLIEAGTRVVSVFWDEYGLAGDAWDTHFDHFARMTDQLCPGLDWGVSGLISDLDERGLLDETLVVLISEHGRTPKINKAAGGGRDHWSRAYSVMLAGGGVARGRVIGATDEIAGDVVDRPVSPKSILATMYHLLGINHHVALPDRSGRPLPLLPEEAEVLYDALA
ncbi:MAG: DUF1501 domain-containing protein [Planctomycetaceae bacterium]|nr:DUF1501 domain-containing protein [Planctomycetaceae bacterium]